MDGKVRHLPGLAGRTGVFLDRQDAGRVLAGMLEGLRGSGALVLASPAGGVPVAAALAAALELELDVAVASKMTPPWNTEVGYGAVAFDGSVLVNEEMVAALGLSPEEVEEGVARTREKVRRRVRLFRGGRPLPEFASRAAVLVDDGLASGYTMLVSLRALRRLSPLELLAAVPTAPARTADRVAGETDGLWCANVRRGPAFAVADAYRRWSDVSDEEVLRILREARGGD